MLLNSNSKYFSLESIDLKLKKNCKLGKKNNIISTQIDQIITPNILKHGKWDYFLINFLKKIIKNKKEKFNFVDIGANIGLISKQLINENINIEKFYCVEPEKKNFLLLTKNLKSNKKFFFYNVALTNKNSKHQKIYLNKNNSGDHSLIRKKNSKSYLVKCVNINIFFKSIFNQLKKNKIIYKSDTQGFDEILILSLEKKYLEQINILMLEISNFSFLRRNKNKLIKLSKNFDIIEDEYGNKIDQKKLLFKLNQEQEFNIFFAKN